MPAPDDLYYRPAPAPEPEPQPAPGTATVVAGILHLNLRTGPGINHTDIGDLHPAAGPLQVISSVQGADGYRWYLVAGYAREDYLTIHDPERDAGSPVARKR